MPIEPKHLDLALKVKRGDCRLREVADADRPFVHAVLTKTTDAQFAQLALSKERHHAQPVARRVFTPKHSLKRA